MSDPIEDVQKILEDKNIGFIDAGKGILRCGQCRRIFRVKKSWLNITGRPPAGWWKCPEGCWKKD